MEFITYEQEGYVGIVTINRPKALNALNSQVLEELDATFKAIDLDARKVDEKFTDESFDAILIDAPCSGFGLIRRKPEIRYEKQLSDSYNLQKIQLEILAAVAPKIKKNGIITYSTCTILRQENDDVVNQFLANHPEFTLERTQTNLNLKDDRQSDTLTILPSDYGSDGFFVSSLRRTM